MKNLKNNNLKKLEIEITNIDFVFKTMLATIPEDINILPSEWNEQNRILTRDFSAKPGRLSFNNSPFWKEIIDNLAPTNPTREVVVMKGNQLGFTQIVLEGFLGYTIDKFPQPVLYVSADRDLAQENMASRIDAMISTAGLSDKIKPSIVKKKRNKTGDTKNRKEFYGGFISALGAKNANKLRQVGFSVVLADEVDTYSKDLQGQGSTISLIRRRTDAFSKIRKILWGSTPLIKGASNIEDLFHEGDQRYYYVPCPICGKMQKLVWGDGKGAGIRFERDGGGRLVLDSVHYQCENGCKIKETQKYNMLLKGKWIAEGKASREGTKSYHISALYSNFLQWSDIINEWIDCGEDKNKLRVFYNNVLAQTWAEEVKTIKYQKVMQNIRNYKPGIVPNKMAIEDGNGRIVLITAAVDVNGIYEKPDGWFAFEVKGHCENGQTYSIMKAEINGTIEPMGGAWLALKYILEQPIKSDDGLTYKIDLTGVDVGFKPESGYWFANFCDRVIPLVGRNTPSKNDNIFQKRKVPKGVRWAIDTIYYKNLVVDYVKKQWGRRPQEQPFGFMNFPDSKQRGGLESTEFEKQFGVTITGYGYNDRYFKSFGSEAPIIEKTDPNNENGKVVGWKKRNSRSLTHFWDVTVYNFAVRDIFLNVIGSEVLGLKNADPQGVLAFLSEYLEENNIQFGN